MVFISYYTKGTPYEDVIKSHLLPSLYKWNLKCDIEAIEDLGDWYANTGYKPRHILKMLLKYREDVVFNDSDAVIEKYPALLSQIPEKEDMACHFLDWYRFWRGIEGNPKRELLSGTMLWRYRPKVIDLLEKYISLCQKYPTTWEQKILQNILSECNDYQIYDLPVEYCTIIRRDGTYPAYIKEPVILHYQASRQYKR
ncbi:MAG: hypothetical protein JW902_07720 [Syntrophaceae bacterium]|nr:hypothetical protein [Syntrophaceae bacterium]